VATDVEQVPLFDFMVVRAAEEVAAGLRRRRYIEDLRNATPRQMATAGAGIGGLVASSRIARLVATVVSGWAGAPGDPKAKASLFQALVADADNLGMVPRRGLLPGPGTTPTILLGELEAGAYLLDESNHCFYLLPDRLGRLQPELPYLRLAKALQELRRSAAGSGSFDVVALRQRLAVILGAYVEEYVYGAQSGTEHWGLAHRTVFDALYLLYIARRWTTVNLEPMIAALQGLHTLEALATDAVVEGMAVRRTGPAGTGSLWPAVLLRWPELSDWSGGAMPPGFSLIGSRRSLAECLTAQPVMHPLFAELFWYGRPFNDVKPIGVGDLKVVRQWLTSYRPGEISDIHNVMMGERRSRSHRRVERTEETFSFTDSRSEDTTKDHQSTERFEVKTEAEAVLRNSLNVNASANSSLSYGSDTGMKITASVGLGFAYNRASEDHQKTAHNFARDVVDKAVSRVESRTASARSTTKIFQTEEMNDQAFDNKTGKTHVSGIYRWVDKEYTAQLYNYGKRLMFEFLVPEPAAFWTESRMRAYEAELDVPKPPPKPQYDELDLTLKASQIDPKKFDELQQTYDLGDLRYPPEEKVATVVNRADGGAVFEEKDLTDIGGWDPRGHSVTIADAAGYDVVGMQLSGKIDYVDAGAGAGADANLFLASLNGSPLMQMLSDNGNTIRNFWFGALRGTPAPVPLAKDDNLLLLGLQNVKKYRLSIDVRLKLGARLREWQDEVLDRVRDAELKRVNAANQEKKLAYDADFAEYRNRLAQLEAVRVADVLAGGSDAGNRAAIDEEMKKHCLTLLIKEFDADASDDVLSSEAATRSRKLTSSTTRFEITQHLDEEPPAASARFIHPDLKGHYRAIDIPVARRKGVVVQFLEQAFEWERLSYVFYPYFWAKKSQWVELANRSSTADPTFAAFLRAGMARVLVAVTPGYDDAVLHYLKTREPWDGGPSPVIGDPLFIPLYEEVRRQQDDRLGGTAEGEPWTFTVPTALVYLHQSATPLPDLAAERKARQDATRPATAEATPNGRTRTRSPIEP
jgi:hypothetical protein